MLGSDGRSINTEVYFQQLVNRNRFHLLKDNARFCTPRIALNTIEELYILELLAHLD